MQSHGTVATVGKLVRCIWHSQCVNNSKREKSKRKENSKREISLLLVTTEIERIAPGTGVI